MSNVKNETMDNSTVCEMFEEVKALQIKGLKAIEEIRSMSATTSEPAPDLNPEDGKRIETLAEKLDGVSEKLNHPLRHHHTLDFMGNKALIVLVAAVGALLVSLWIIHNQRGTIARNRDNDLKCAVRLLPPTSSTSATSSSSTVTPTASNSFDDKSSIMSN